MLQVPSTEAFPMWVVGVTVTTIARATATIVIFRKRRKEIPVATVSKVAISPKKAQKLVEANFEHEKDIDHMKIFGKRK